MKNLLKNKEILLILGGSCLAVIGVVAVKKASLKCTEIMAEHKATETIINECPISDKYTEEDRVQDHLIIKSQTAVKIMKNYILPYTVVLTGGCIVINGCFRMYKKNKIGECEYEC